MKVGKIILAMLLLNAFAESVFAANPTSVTLKTVKMTKNGGFRAVARINQPVPANCKMRIFAAVSQAGNLVTEDKLLGNVVLEEGVREVRLIANDVSGVDHASGLVEDAPVINVAARLRCLKKNGSLRFSLESAPKADFAACGEGQVTVPADTYLNQIRAKKVIVVE